MVDHYHVDTAVAERAAPQETLRLQGVRVQRRDLRRSREREHFQRFRDKQMFQQNRHPPREVMTN